MNGSCCYWLDLAVEGNEGLERRLRGHIDNDRAGIRASSGGLQRQLIQQALAEQFLVPGAVEGTRREAHLEVAHVHVCKELVLVSM